jgi:basic membrane protein A and related proteins
MLKKKIWSLIIFTILVSMVLAACTPQAPQVAPPPTAPPAAEQPAAPQEPAAPPTPTKVRWACITSDTVEQPWHTAFAQAFERVKKDPPHGLEMTMTCTESVAPPDAERILRQYAETGNYDIILAHSAYHEAVRVLAPEFPDIAWLFTGSGNEPIGGNAYWGDVFIHEPSYLAGMIAGSLTKTNKLAAVAAFPFPNVNGPVNAFYDGAKSVNPDITMTVTYIESWFDPVKGKEAATAQIATGVDIIYAERFGPFEAAQEAGILAFGHFLDQNPLAPDIVVASPMAMWDANIKNIIEVWWQYTVNGVPYNAPMERIVFSFIEGGSALSPYHGFANVIPQDLQDKVEETRQKILSGELKIPLRTEAFEQ